LGKVAKVSKSYNYNFAVYYLYHSGKVIASFHIGSSAIKTKEKILIKTIYYLKIRFAGLSSRKRNIDEVSHKTVDEIIGYLNTKNIEYKIVELDVAVDMFCGFDNVLAVVTRKYPNVKYHPLGHTCKICGDTISYLEDYSQRVAHKATRRSYLYDKTAKEGLSFKVTRFEVKLQKNFFYSYGLDIGAISKIFDNYSIICFTNKNGKTKAIQRLKRTKNFDFAIRSLEKYNFKVELDISVVAKFIYKVQNTFIDRLGNTRTLPVPKNFSVCLYSEENNQQ